VGARVLGGIAQFVQLVALRLRGRERLVEFFLRQLRRAGQDPQVFPVGRADDRPAVVRVQADHPVVALERLEERDFELGVVAAVHDLGGARGGIDIAVLGAAAIVDADGAVGVQGVFGGRVSHAVALVEHGEIRDLVPHAGVAFQVHRFDGPHGRRGMDDPRHAGGQGQQECCGAAHGENLLM
jgi:hypothetical protein